MLVLEDCNGSSSGMSSRDIEDFLERLDRLDNELVEDLGLLDELVGRPNGYKKDDLSERGSIFLFLRVRPLFIFLSYTTRYKCVFSILWSRNEVTR